MAQPEHILNGVLKKIAEENSYEDFTINIKPITSGGANYSSHIFIATISAAGKPDLNVFAKVIGAGDKMRSPLPDNVFVLEHYCYAELLKIYRSLENEYKVPEAHRLITAKFYGGCKELSKETVVLENLSILGYESFDRFKSMDWQYASSAIKQLALFHALSLIYAKKYPKEFERTSKIVMQEGTGTLLAGPADIAIDNTLKSIKEEYKERITKVVKGTHGCHNFEKLYKGSKLPVIAHGDYRPSNLMHKINNDGSVTVLPVDYQTLQIANPVTDLLYLLFLGSDKKFRDKYYQASLDHYYKELRDSLQRFEIDLQELYSKDDFEEEVMQGLPYILTLCFFILPMVTVDGSNAPQLSTEMAFEDFIVTPNKLCAERINDIIEDFIKIGIL